MNILHISFSDRKGGAAIAAYRHHEAMRRAGIDSKMLVIDKLSDDEHVIQYTPTIISKGKKFLYRILNKSIRILNNYYASWSFSKYGYDLSHERAVNEADVIIIHWVNAYTLSIKGIERILKLGKPVYWFMHDMWPITGGCHHALDCTRYITHCEKCPMCHDRAGSKRIKDLSWSQFEEKFKRLSGRNNLYFVTPSRWLADKVKESSLFGSHNIKIIKNVLNTNVFNLTDQQEARKRLNLPVDKKLILFGADNIHSPYKGWQYLRDALNKPLDGIECVLYGASHKDIQSQIGIKVHQMGTITEESKLVDIYNACDVFVTPSLADNYPNVILEAMSCGLPVVAFPSGGIPELVTTGENGILTSAHDVGELYTGIKQILTMPTYQYKRLRSSTRYGVIQNNDYASMKWF